jgi:hypothetical protein
MDAATEKRAAGAISAWLAGLQAGMLGAFGMLAWLGLSAEWHRRSFWTAENLMASAFWGSDALRSGFGFRSLSGLALYLVIYSLLGALFALALRSRVRPTRILLLGIIFALAWYYLSYRLIYEKVLPLVSLLHVERQTVLGHLIYGTFVGRFPAYLPKPPSAEPVAEPEPAPQTPSETPEGQQ